MRSSLFLAITLCLLSILSPDRSAGATEALATIDGETVEPILDRVNFLNRTLKQSMVVEPGIDINLDSAVVGVIFVYPTNGLPQSATMTWVPISPPIRWSGANAAQQPPRASFITPTPDSTRGPSARCFQNRGSEGAAATCHTTAKPIPDPAMFQMSSRAWRRAGSGRTEGPAEKLKMRSLAVAAAEVVVVVMAPVPRGVYWGD